MAIDKLISKTELFISFLLGIFHFWLVRYIYYVVPHPYMDEICHLNQTRAYCLGNYDYWNPLITTPPALYLLSVPFFCNKERYFNSFLMPICFIGICLLRKKWFLKKTKFNLHCILTAFNIVTLPVLFDTSILYYTDLLSLTTTVMGILLINYPLPSALVFLIAILTRQTNIVWAAMICFFKWLENLNFKQPILSTLNTIKKFWTFVVLGLGFVIFVYVNKGIVLGDRSAHKPVLHCAQILYFFSFVAISSLPLFINELFNKKFWISIICKPYKTISLFILFSFISHYFSMSHPYLLSDNRHITFYLWRKVFNSHWYIKLVMNLFNVISFNYFIKKMSFPFKYFNFVFLFAISVCIVPAHLIEFRYFIIGYSIWRLTVFESKKLFVCLEVLWTTILNFVALYIFIYKPFVWQHDNNKSLQRFMW